MIRAPNTHPVTRVSPSLHSPLEETGKSSLSPRRDPFAHLRAYAEPLHITTTRRNVRAVAVSFGASSLLSTQLEPRVDNSLAISLRLNELNPLEPDHQRTPQVARAVWNALFLYFAANEAVTGTIDLPLPSQPLADALLSLGATVVSPSWEISRSAIFQLFQYAVASSIPIPYPYLPTTTGAVTHPTRPLRPSSSVPLYSRYIPALESYFKLQLCTPNDLETIHSWMNTPRVDLYWEQKGSLADHERFIAEHIVDRHLLSIIGSFVHVNSEGEVKEPEPATYLELYWAKEDRLGALYDAKDYDRGSHFVLSFEFFADSA